MKSIYHTWNNMHNNNNHDHTPIKNHILHDKKDNNPIPLYKERREICWNSIAKKLFRPKKKLPSSIRQTACTHVKEPANTKVHQNNKYIRYTYNIHILIQTIIHLGLRNSFILYEK